MEERLNMHHRRPRSAALLCCCCFGSDDSAAERSLLKPSWFYKVARSNSGSEAAAMDLDSPKWWRKSWNSVRRAGEWSETVVEDYAGGCCSGPKWKNFVRRCKADGKSIYSTRPARFHYDQMDYQLNFDEGGLQGQGLSEKMMDFPASSKLSKGEAEITTAL
ncbi:hypothetical protein SUGI_0897840 [Cryptomeria japonica]|uniref:uncharacterized protein LOC131077924 n=1 Tax=Cryptomeria japonica TaxID=3369 RepID=UPI002414BDB6|nr:uncharacterized protein LOC131077924 [Cryptomeria japonica]GLJ43242.1 hypothetical protein SUGI_0897840 [Cryptomeria japonica]